MATLMGQETQSVVLVRLALLKQPYLVYMVKYLSADEGFIFRFLFKILQKQKKTK